MSRDPSRILSFKRLTRLGRVKEVDLTRKVSKRILKISTLADDKKLKMFARPYLYVALATCLEADLKYKTRLAMEIAGNDVDVFKRLYGEGKVDLDLLFHVVNESITLVDLVGEATNVSDMPSLLGKTEGLLNLLSGNKNKLVSYFRQVTEEKVIEAGMENALSIALSRYDKIIKDVDYVFQIRHAIVHDIVSNQGPMRGAIKRDKLADVSVSCMAFLLLSDRAVFRELRHGPLRTRDSPPKSRRRKCKASSRRVSYAKATEAAFSRLRRQPREA